MKAEREDELRNAPGLRGMKSANPFEVPEGYFDSLSARIQDKLNTPKPITLWEKLVEPLQRPAFAYATISLVVLIFAGVYFYQKQNPLPAKQMSEASVSMEDLYSSGIIDEYDENTLIEVLALNSSEKSAATEMDDYLIDENTSETDFINEL